SAFSVGRSGSTTFWTGSFGNEASLIVVVGSGVAGGDAGTVVALEGAEEAGAGEGEGATDAFGSRASAETSPSADATSEQVAPRTSRGVLNFAPSSMTRRPTKALATLVWTPLVRVTWRTRAFSSARAARTRLVRPAISRKNASPSGQVGAAS